MAPELWRKIEEICQAALDLPPEQRAARLNELCGGDSDLRTQVESLLQFEGAQLPLDGSAWQSVAELLDEDAVIATGTQLGPYRVEGLLGVGGMGSVYRGWDTRLERDVAIKTSKEEFSERFAREARALAALNHSNICTVYDVGPDYLVAEFIEGPTLADRMKQGRLPVDEALRIARQVATALEAAHERGIVHRDLKPGNIKVRPDGAVKVLDFGLAKWRATESGLTVGPDDAATQSAIETRAGVIMGTAAYMSPEQARGEPVDKRTDIWAFGVVLYEMLTGSRLFRGETVGDTLEAVLTSQPSWDRIPANLRRLVQACLERDPRSRLRDIGDVWRLIENGDHDLPRREWRWRLVSTVLAVALLVAVGAWWSASHPPEKELVHLDVDLGSEVSLGGAIPGTDVIISPDGTRLVFVAGGRLFTRGLNHTEAVELPGTDGAGAPFFSPDGRWIGFFTQNKLKKIAVEGGVAINLCDLSGTGNGGGSWSEGGTIIAALGPTGPLFEIAAKGGAPQRITGSDRPSIVNRWPQVLPGGKAVLFTSHTAPYYGFDAANIAVLDLREHVTKIVQRGGSFGRYLPSGHLVYVSRGALFAVPFDLGQLEESGTPTVILDSISYSAESGQAQIDFSRTGTAVYRKGALDGNSTTLQLLDSTGKPLALIAKPGEYRMPRLSPDGRRLLFMSVDGADQELWTYDLGRQIAAPLTTKGGVNRQPLWTTDGKYIVYASQGGVFWIPAEGLEKTPKLLIRDVAEAVWTPWSFTPEGDRLALQQNIAGQTDIWSVPIKIDFAGLHAGAPEPLIKTIFNERAPAFSPEGRWIAYESNESGRYEVYVCGFPCSDRRQVSSEGGQLPVWSPAGDALFYSTADGRVMTVKYSALGNSFEGDKPHEWFDGRLAVPTGRNFDVAPDGKHIAAVVPVQKRDQQRPNHIVFLENFFDYLGRHTRTH